MDVVNNKLEVSDHVKKLRLEVNALEEELKSRLSKVSINTFDLLFTVGYIYQLSCEHDQLQQDFLIWRKESGDNMDDVHTTLSPLTEQVFLLL